MELPKHAYFTPKQIMEFFSIGKTLVYSMIADGDFGMPIKCGGLKIHRSGILEFIARREQEMAAELEDRFL